MILYTLHRLRRSPVTVFCILVFVAILSIALCLLQKSNDRELEKYNQTIQTISVEVRVTNLSGTSYKDLGISTVFADYFTAQDCLGGYLTNVQQVCTHAIQGTYSGSKLTGITSLELSPELWAENGATIDWYPGYNQQIFAGSELLCLIPSGLSTQTDEQTGAEYVELLFEVLNYDTPMRYTLRLQVAGTYRGGDGKTIYCPFPVCQQVYTELGEFPVLQSLGATLKNNDDLETFRAEALRWFAVPNALGEKTPYEGDDLSYSYYPYALNINDELLQRACATLQTSITTNRICTVVVLCISAVASFLLGFLTVRHRKREIALLRTIGTANRAIYGGFALEQMLCVVLGIGLGGAYDLWRPAGRLATLALTYFVGLSAALLIFLHQKLLTIIKEDE